MWKRMRRRAREGRRKRGRKRREKDGGQDSGEAGEKEEAADSALNVTRLKSLNSLPDNTAAGKVAKPPARVIATAPGAKQASKAQPYECIFPATDPFDPQLKSALKVYPPLDCSKHTANIVYLENFVAKVNHSKLSLVLSDGYNFSHCRCKEIKRKNGSDKDVKYTWTSETFTDSLALEPWQENIMTECFDTKKRAISRSYFPLIRVKNETERFLKKNYKKYATHNSPLETLSILVLGIDGMSKQHFERSMPKTRNFLLEKMGAIEMYKYNKLAFETFTNVLALLTGHTPEEFYKDWHYNQTEFVDQINEAFIWTDARKIGYRTGMMLDTYNLTAFHYQKKGFKESPVDYYQRQTVIASERDKLMRGNDSNCAGDISEVTQIHDYWLQMARTFGKDRTTPFFAYSFAVRITHDDCNLAYEGDDVYYKFLQDLVATDSLDNMVIVWFSDHGPRFGPIRETYNGRIETSTPYIFFVFPPWFERKYPKLISTLKINQNRLSSHFDTYETLRDLLYFKAGEKPSGKLSERGISLFREIPKERTCQQAGIPSEFCACGRLSRLNLTNQLQSLLGMALLDRINSFIGHRNSSTLSSFVLSKNSKHTINEGNSFLPVNFSDSNVHRHSTDILSDSTSRLPSEQLRKKCSPLTLLAVERVYHVTNDQLQSLKTKTYRVTIKTTPGFGLFEGLVNYEPGDSGYVMGDIVRINLYRGQAECVQDPWVRQFCFCVK
ncbi:hypothetical protein PoB_005526300 [Plakobranchus ocellatus]|uniref:Sulfatase N-terminal domain-containing protein n=1 Tax=Plakobranchus ocellatus TaxID=259542 RepID=A0AAV4CB86_9GAST|nr:hypothetical protein PoB_005526300 [Plakobranchus ocellatus]